MSGNASWKKRKEKAISYLVCERPERQGRNINMMIQIKKIRERVEVHIERAWCSAQERRVGKSSLWSCSQIQKQIYGEQAVIPWSWSLMIALFTDGWDLGRVVQNVAEIRKRGLWWYWSSGLYVQIGMSRVHSFLFHKRAKQNISMVWKSTAEHGGQLPQERSRGSIVHSFVRRMLYVYVRVSGWSGIESIRRYHTKLGCSLLKRWLKNRSLHWILPGNRKKM